MVYITFMSGGGAITAIIFQIIWGQSFSENFKLPIKVKIAGFFGVALYTVMLAQAFGISSMDDR